MIKSAWDGLQNVVAGLMTERDKHSYSKYGLITKLDHLTLASMYRGSWLCKRIVNSVADDMTREWIEVCSKQSDDLNFITLDKNWGLRSKVREALRWARLYGGSVIIIGTKGEDLSSELNIETFKRGSLSYLIVKDRHFISDIGNIEMDIESPNFNYPVEYMLAVQSKTVHWSRVIRFEGQPLPEQEWVTNNRWGDSELQHVVDSVTSYDATRANIMAMLYESNVDVFKIAGMGELLATKEGEKKLIKRFQTSMLMKSVNRAELLDMEDSYEKKSNNFTNLADIWGRFIDDVSGACEIPIARLFGQSPGGISATGKGELINYYDMISNKQETDLTAPLTALINLLIINEYGSLPEDISWKFKPLWQMSEAEETATRKTRADQDKIYHDMGVVSPAIIAQRLLDENVYPAMTEEDIELLKELELELPDPEADTLNATNDPDEQPEQLVENQ